MPRTIDRTGQRYGRLLVVRRDDETPRKPGTAFNWWCQCDCGSPIRSVRGDGLGIRVNSCGCLHREQFAERNTRHGAARRGEQSRAYGIWSSMKNRCLNPLAPRYDCYGDRGITVCDRWMDFASFLADMGEPPAGMTLERKDNNLGYCPENCVWATRREQSNNTRWNRNITVNGITASVAEWSEKLGLPRNSALIHQRIDKLGWSEEKAVTTPVKKKKPRV